jgi:hypothetical protein
MDIEKLHSSLKGLYQTYNDVVRYLIIEIELRSQKFPLPLFNEIRAFNDHIARCYLDDATDDTIYREVIHKAERHLTRITLDCYKFLIIILDDKLKLFERQTRNVDLTVIEAGVFASKFMFLKKKSKQEVRVARVSDGDGTFLQKFKKLIRESTYQVGIAKRKEISNNSDAIVLYEKAYKSYVELEELMDSVSIDVKWARVKFTFIRILKIIIWLLAAVISGFISVLITCSSFTSFVKRLFY